MMQPTPTPSSPPGSPRVVESILAPPQNAGSAPFQVLAKLFDKLQNERNPEKRRKSIHAWFTHWREEKGYDLYPVLRLLLPQKDRERAVYGLKEKNLAKSYIKLIPLQPKDSDAIRLVNWKKPTEKDKSSGDFPSVLYEVVSKRSSVIEGSLSVDELNDILDELAQNMGKSDIQAKIMQNIYNRATPEEQRWIVRIILKDMNISVKETTVFSVFHPDAHDLFNTCSDLKKVAWELWDPSRRLNSDEKAVQLFRAFAPMLCKRPTRKIEESVKEMQGRTFIIEEKLDGERMQLHKRGNEYFYCSRKGKDYTYLYGKDIGGGSLTPFIEAAFDERVDDIILDGEMLVWDPVSERNLPFGSLKTAALDKSKKEYNPRPCFKVFDLLYLNGMSLLQKPLRFRKRNLRSCVKEIKGRIEFATEYEGKTAKDVRQRMDDIMAERGEGLVIKHPGSEYVLNGRNKDWIKVKPEYMDNMGETVDVIVVGGNWGRGKRAGGVSALICAVLDDRQQLEVDEEPKYSTFVRIGTGLSFADYVWVRNKPWKAWDHKNTPKFLQTAKRGNEDRGDVYLEPEDSFILKVMAAEIVVSDQYHIGFTMRFPRALQIRDDLSTADCMTASAVIESIRSVKKRKMENDAGLSNKKKRKKTVQKSTFLPEYQGPNLQDVEVESDIFEEMNFVVISDPKSKTGDEDKRQLMKLIKAHGGLCFQIAGKQPNLAVVYGGITTPYDVKLIINKGVHDIIKPQWILDSISLRHCAPLSKKYFFHATATRAETHEYVDGDDEMDEPLGLDDKTDDQMEANHADEATDEKSEDGDPSLADWFKVEKKGRAEPANDDDSETEPETDADSDNEDVTRDDMDDTWLKVEQSPDLPTSSLDIDDIKEEEAVLKMGESDAAMEYDQDLIFKHLCFYLDSPDNAHKIGMPVKPKHEKDINASFVELAKVIQQHGGKVVDLDEPKLTHVVIDKRDVGRRLELMKRTSTPKRRHLIVTEFIQACLDEETLLPEDEFAP